METIKQKETLNNRGARQVGKSWIMKEKFAKRYYEDYVYISFDKEPEAKKYLHKQKILKFCLRE